MFEYDTRLVRVIDGDTVVLDVDLGFSLTIRQTFRLTGINAPEMRGKESSAGIASTEYLKTRLEGVKTFKIKTIKTIHGEDKKGKYGRYLATIFVDSVNINDEMVKSGHAVPAEYKSKWNCDSNSVEYFLRKYYEKSNKRTT